MASDGDDDAANDVDVVCRSNLSDARLDEEPGVEVGSAGFAPARDIGRGGPTQRVCGRKRDDKGETGMVRGKGDVQY